MSDADRSYVAGYLTHTIQAISAFAEDAAVHDVLFGMARTITASLRDGKKLMIAGNGGSAGDAQHIAGEFIVRLMYDRAPLAAIALTTDGSVMTAGSNDYGFDFVFERQVIGLGRPGDVFLGISTSGSSPNVLRALAAARAGGIATMGFTGGSGGKMVTACDQVLIAPATQTALIQQVHIVAAHIVCALVERAMFPPAD